MDMACAIFMKMQWYEDLKINVPGCLCSNSQIHKYTNTASVKVADRHGMCYIYENAMVRGKSHPGGSKLVDKT